jgi:hypothetical protein
LRIVFSTSKELNGVEEGEYLSSHIYKEICQYRCYS